MKSKPNIVNRLNFRIIAPVVIMLSLIGVGLSIFVLGTLTDFNTRSINEDMVWTSRLTYDIVNRRYYDMVMSGGLKDRKLERISQGNALGELEEFGRQKNFNVIVYSETEDRLVLDSGFPIDFIRRMEHQIPESETGRIKWAGREYYIYRFDFDPWRWHIVHLKDASQYASLIANIRYAYLAIGFILAFAAALLYLLLRWNINRPIGQIIHSLEKDDHPAYRGIMEFEYLTSGIGTVRESEEKYRFLTENVTDVIWTMDLDLHWTYLSPSITRMRGYSVEEMLQMNLEDSVTPDSFRAAQREFAKEIAMETGGGDPGRSRTLELEFFHKDGGTVWGEVTTRFLRDDDGKVVGLVGVTRDITERKLANAALKESEERFRTAFRTSPDSININRLEDGVYIDINEGFSAISGYSREDILGKSSLEIDMWTDPEDREKLVEGLKKTGKVENLEAVFCMKDGRIVTGLMSAKSFDLGGVPHILSVTRDISDLKAAQDRLTASVEEKELLLKEIHHRVKNNLQVISGLMNLQALHVTDEEARNVYRESQNRVITMALIHEELYQAADLAHVDLAAYIQNLASNLFQSYGAKRGRVNLVLETEQIDMVVDTAIPCGLIINELISNSLKHAFPDGKKGEIRIGFRVLDDGEYELTVSDDGVGLPDGFDVSGIKSMGLQLVTLLMNQLGGTLEASGTDGARFTMRFKEYKEAGTTMY